MASTSRNPFAPSTRFHSKTSPSNSSRQVTLPPLPELHDPAFLDLLLPPSSDTYSLESRGKAGSGDISLDISNEAARLTQNGHTRSRLLNAFNILDAEMEAEPSRYEPCLKLAWDEDPLSTIRLIFHLRSIHQGRALRAEFYRAFAWLYRNHPRSAIGNLEVLVAPLIARRGRPRKSDEEKEDGWTFAETEEEADLRPDVKVSHGYFKDLLNILLLETNGELEPESEFEALLPPRIPKSDNPRRNRRREPAINDWAEESIAGGDGGWGTAAADDGAWGTAAPEWTSAGAAEPSSATTIPTLASEHNQIVIGGDVDGEKGKVDEEGEGGETASEDSRASPISTPHSMDSRARREAAGGRRSLSLLPSELQLKCLLS